MQIEVTVTGRSSHGSMPWEGLNPLEHGWLAAKLVAVIGYIGFGFITLRFARSRSQQITAFSCATVTFAYIVLVAITREPWPPTALL